MDLTGSKKYEQTPKAVFVIVLLIDHPYLRVLFRFIDWRTLAASLPCKVTLEGLQPST